MKKFTLILALMAIIPSYSAFGAPISDVTGYILLQVESKGEAWYSYPANNKVYYLGRPDDAFKIMKQLSLGAKHDFISKTNIFPDRLSGMILLDVEKSGEAYYIYPLNKKKYYLGRPMDAFKIMRELGLGISNKDLAKMIVGKIGEPIDQSMTSKKILIENVPFTTQAPFGDWADSRQQNGCEESSALMAIRWVRGQSLSKDGALKEIIAIADYTQKKYGESRDTSAQNTIDWIFKDYFKYDKVALIKDMTIDKIIEELEKGHLIVTPMNGQLMHNPNYKQPGPPRHMIVIRGYDPATKEFITNDPGTRRGELYRYNSNVLYAAIRDYPTGYHETINKVEKDMIVIWK